jgi:hypothetical protein
MKARLPLGAPAPPPFPVGTRLRYTGASQIGTTDATGATVWILFPGAAGTIVRVREGRCGTGRYLDDDDSGAAIYDTTEPGYSVWQSDAASARNTGRCIDNTPDALADWVVL